MVEYCGDKSYYIGDNGKQWKYFKCLCVESFSRSKIKKERKEKGLTDKKKREEKRDACYLREKG